jgi:hypothetical protein
MIGYRFLPPADEEMSEASLFYEGASTVAGLQQMASKFTWRIR